MNPPHQPPLCMQGAHRRLLAPILLWPCHHHGENHMGMLSLSEHHAAAEDQTYVPPPVFPFHPKLIAIDHRAWWALILPTPLDRTLRAPGSSWAPRPPVPRRWSAKFDWWATDARWGWDPLPSAVGQKARCSWAIRRAELEASMGSAHWHSNMFLFPFGLIWIIQIMFKPLEICSNSNKFNKNINSISLFEFKHIL
jgi:hypothetical protein